MKRIHLIRHAKSSWEDDTLADFERPLNGRGVRTSRFMATHIYDAGCSFVNVFCSPAVRAQSTIEIISKGLPEMAIQWQVDDNLYSFDSGDLYRWCRSLNDSISECVIIGHNPALTELCNGLSKGDIKNIPTCGYAQLTTHSEHNWRKISEMPFELTEFLRPKKLMK